MLCHFTAIYLWTTSRWLWLWVVCHNIFWCIHLTNYSRQWMNGSLRSVVHNIECFHRWDHELTKLCLCYSSTIAISHITISYIFYITKSLHLLLVNKFASFIVQFLLRLFLAVSPAVVESLINLISSFFSYYASINAFFVLIHLNIYIVYV